MASDENDTDRPVRRRRRGAALEQAILEAALAELSEGGYPALTIDRIARRAGTNKNAIYRRWRNRAALGVAAYRLLVVESADVPDTGQLRNDALELLRRANRHLASPAGEMLRDLLAGAVDDPDFLTQLLEQASDAGSNLWLTILERAVARNEAPPESLVPRVATVAVVLLRNEFVTRGISVVSDDVLVEIVDEIYLPLIRGRGLPRGEGA